MRDEKAWLSEFGVSRDVSALCVERNVFRYRPLRVTIRLADGTAVSTLLPVAYKEGIVMQVVKEGNDRFRVDLQSTVASGSGSVGADPRIYLIAHTRQSVKLAETAFLREGKCSFLVDRNMLGDGSSHLTI